MEEKQCIRNIIKHLNFTIQRRRRGLFALVIIKRSGSPGNGPPILRHGKAATEKKTNSLHGMNTQTDNNRGQVPRFFHALARIWPGLFVCLQEAINGHFSAVIVPGAFTYPRKNGPPGGRQGPYKIGCFLPDFNIFIGRIVSRPEDRQKSGQKIIIFSLFFRCPLFWTPES